MDRIVIMGCGPAGISAALYAKRAGLETIVIGGGISALSQAELVENYYGVLSPLTGQQLFEIGFKQARDLGCHMILDEVVGLTFDAEFSAQTAKNGEISGDALIIATGRPRVRPQIEGIIKFEGRGVSYCAICDAFFYRQKKVVVIGNGAYAVTEAKELMEASEVTILTNGPVSELVKNSNISFVENKIANIAGESRVESVLFEDGSEIKIAGVFVAMGSASSVDFAKKIGLQVDNNRIIVDEDQATNFPGVFAAGDCCAKISQIVVAAAQGAVAALSAVKFVRDERLKKGALTYEFEANNRIGI